LKRRGLPRRFSGDRAALTVIYYLLQGRDFSAFHRIKSDETWHLHAGTLSLFRLTARGRLVRHRLSLDPRGGGAPLAAVPAGDCFAAAPDAPRGWALVSCVVAPGFDFRDFELARRSDLVRRFPRHRALVTRLTR
jgi:predicted cupin superfamily sugar epimerase